MSTTRNTKLRYRTFDQVLADVKIDLPTLDANNEIQPQALVKVVKKINKLLGIKIQKTKNVVLDIVDGWVKLPDDFDMVNFLYVLGRYEEIVIPPQGTHVEEVVVGVPIYNPSFPNGIDICAVPDPCPTPAVPECNTCENPKPCSCSDNCSTWINCKGETTTLIQKIKYGYRKYVDFYKVHLVGNLDFIDPFCPNKSMVAKTQAFITDDNFLKMGVQSGQIYLSYEGMMEDEKGNLLVLDHDLINDYYEYACKDRIFENKILNSEPVTQAAVQLIAVKLKEARNLAEGITRMPEYYELKEAWQLNRKAKFRNYFLPFKTK